MSGTKWIIVRADQEMGTLYLKKVRYRKFKGVNVVGKWRSLCSKDW